MLILSMLRRGAVQFHWSAEIYGFGSCFRRFAGYPNFLPLFLTSDHGINISQYMDPAITSGSIGCRIHLTWSEKNAESHVPGITMVPIQHPWLMHLESTGVANFNSRYGSIFYPLHKAPGFSFIGLDDEESIRYLKSLPKKFHPIDVSLHMHDLGGERQELFEKSGFKTVTLGETSDPDFHKKFFTLVSNYQYAFSESWGSQIPFLVKNGIPTQIVPRTTTITRDGESEPVHSAEFEKELRNAEKLFANLPHFINQEQLDYVDRLLGVQYKMSPEKFSRIIYGQLFNRGLIWMLRFGITVLVSKVAKSRTQDLKNCEI